MSSTRQPVTLSILNSIFKGIAACALEKKTKTKRVAVSELKVALTGNIESQTSLGILCYARYYRQLLRVCARRFMCMCVVLFC